MEVTQRRPSAFTIILSVLLWPVAFVITLIFYSFGLLVLPFSVLLDHGTRARMHWVARIWARGLMAAGPRWKLEVRGAENIEPGKHYVIVANHQSILDIQVVLAGLPLHFKFLAKQELFNIPLLGWHMSLAGYIPLVRGNRESARDALTVAKERLQQKVSVLFFPEGTRSDDGEVKDFKPGAFRLAADQGVDILPVTLDGTADVIPKHSLIFKSGAKFIVQIDKPVPITPETTAEVVTKVREQIKQRLSEIRHPSPLAGEDR